MNEIEADERLIESVEGLHELAMNDELLAWGPRQVQPRHSPCRFDTTPLDEQYREGIPTGELILRASCSRNGWVLNLNVTPDIFPVRVRTQSNIRAIR